MDFVILDLEPNMKFQIILQYLFLVRRKVNIDVVEGKLKLQAQDIVKLSEVSKSLEVCINFAVVKIMNDHAKVFILSL